MRLRCSSHDFLISLVLGHYSNGMCDLFLCQHETFCNDVLII